MALERITDAIKSVLTVGQSRVDSMVGDYERLQRFSRVLRSQVPFEPELIAEIARQQGKLSEQEIQEYLERTQQPQG